MNFILSTVILSFPMPPAVYNPKGDLTRSTHLIPGCRSLTICPPDPHWERALPLPCDACRGGQQCTRELELVAGEEDSPYMHHSLPTFLASLLSLEILRISWHTLDWNLPDNERQALIRLISLESLEELEIVASCNFPLSLLQGFCGSRLHLTFSGDAIPLNVVARPSACIQELVALSLVGQQKIVAFMEYAKGRPEFRIVLRSIETLCITCVEDGRFDSEQNLGVIGSFLQFLDETKIRELRVQDERPNAVIGHTLATQEFRSLRDVGTVEAHLSIKNPLSSHEIYCALRDWITPLLSNLVNSTSLKSFDITYQVRFSCEPELLDGLVEKMKQLWRELDRYLARGFPALEQANVGFLFYGVGGHDWWMEFNADNQPTELDRRGVDCSFWVRDI